MLVLSRKVGERIVIGQGVTITVLDVNGPRVRLGIVAPADVPVYRSEVIPPIQPKDRKPVPQPPEASLAFDVFV